MNFELAKIEKNHWSVDALLRRSYLTALEGAGLLKNWIIQSSILVYC